MVAPLWLSSARQRPIVALTIALITVFTTLVATLGPITLRALEQSALQDALAAAPTGSDDIVLTANTGDSITIAQALKATGTAAKSVTSTLFGSPMMLTETGTLSWRVARKPAGGRVRVAADPDGCGRFVVTAGRCAATSFEVVVPASDLAAGRTRIGSTITVGGKQLPYGVVGGYDPARSTALLRSRIDPGAASADPTTDSDLVMTVSGLTRLQIGTAVSARIPLRADRLRLEDEDQVQRAVLQIRAAVLAQGQVIAVVTGLPDRLSTAAADRDAAQSLVLIVVIQALALAWFSAIVVIAMAARVRAREWALSRLRGERRRSWLLGIFAEPLILIAIGTVGGLALSAVVAQLATDHWLRPGTPIQPFRLPVLLALGLSVGGLSAALVAASLRSARAPLASLLNEGAEPGRVTRLALIGQVLIIGVAGAAVYQLRSAADLSASSARLALVAPALLAAALGVITIDVVSWLVRARTGHRARTLAGVLIVRRLARVPSFLQRNIAVAIVVALAVFTTQLAVLSLHNQDRRAQSQVGADRVLDVQVPSGVDLINVVRRADPGGTYAMAALERRAASDGNTSRIVAVDTKRLPAVMKWYSSWGSGLSANEVAARLHPQRPGQITVTGTQVRVQLRDVVVSAQAPPGNGVLAVPVPELRVIVSDGTRWSDIDLGRLRIGAPRYTGPLFNCQRPCRLVHIYLDNSADQTHTPYTADFTVASIATDTSPAATLAPVLRDSSRWQLWVTNQNQGTDVAATPVGTSAGLRITASDLLGDSEPGVSSADAPDPIPVIAATGVQTDALQGNPGVRVGTGLDGQRQAIQLIGGPAFLPRTLDDGVLADLQYMRALSDPSAAEAQPQVWLRDGAPASIRTALAKAGITITQTELLSTVRHTLSVAATARAATTNLVVVAVAGLMGIAVIVGTQLIDAERRRALWLVARSSRVSRARMARLVLAETAAPAAVAAVIGAVTGVTAIWLAGARLPLFLAGSIGPPLDVSIHWAPAGITLTVAVGAIIVVAAIVSGIEAAKHRIDL